MEKNLETEEMKWDRIIKERIEDKHPELNGVAIRIL